MMNKFSEALSLLWRNLGLFAAIILTVWLPGNILINFITYNYSGVVGDIGVLKLAMWIECIFGPIYIGALVYALNQIKTGGTVTYKEAMTVGFKIWGTLFAARLIAGAFISLGLIALIIPGIILLVRYSMIDAVVVLEGKSAADSRSRSTELTVGRRWQIFGSAIFFFIPFIMLSFIVCLPLELFESLNVMPLKIVLDCIMDVCFAVIQIVIFLFYWESIQPISNAEPNVPQNDGATTIVAIEDKETDHGFQTT